MEPVNCKICNKTFTPKYLNRGKVCSEPCRAKAISNSKMKYTAEQEKQILDLRDQKKTREEISKITGIKISKIKSVLVSNRKTIPMNDRQINARAGLIKAFGSMEAWSEHCRSGLTEDSMNRTLKSLAEMAKKRKINDGLTNSQRYQNRHREEIRAMWNQWNRDNAQYRASQTAKRRALKLRAIPKWCDDAMKKQIEAIYAQRQKGQHVDHIYPLQGKDVSGLHVPQNLRIISAEENLSKGNRMPKRESITNDGK